MSDKPAVWELQPPEGMVQCEDCFALVLTPALGAHENWHEWLLDSMRRP